MPPRKKKITKPALPGPWEIALDSAGSVWAAEVQEVEHKTALDKSFLAGRIKEAVDAHDGLGYTYGITENTVAPPVEVESKYGSPKKKGRPTQPASPVVPWGAPNPNHVYREFVTLRPVLTKAFGSDAKEMTDEIIESSKRLPVGEDIELDFGPASNKAKYHVKIARVKRG